METKITDYSLRFYVRDYYAKNADKRGGEVFTTKYKKDQKHFNNMVKNVVNLSSKVIAVTTIKYPLTHN